MSEMLTVKDVAELCNIPDSLVTWYCRTGRITGAVKEGRAWKIPVRAKKPEDRRKTSKEPVRLSVKRPLPIGVSDFRVACDQYYYIDKTMLIKDFIDERPIVSLFTRPRRFGKP